MPLAADGSVADDTRIVETLPTLRYLMQKNARLVIASHLGRPKGKRDPKQSLRPVRERLEKFLRKPIAFAEMAKWSKFWELFTTYLGRVRGAAEVPLRYLIREQAEVTDTVREPAYDSTEERLIATTVHTGSHYALDNCTLYDELNPWS